MNYPGSGNFFGTQVPRTRLTSLPPTAKWCPMPSQPHTFTHRIMAVEVARCDHGATLRPTGHRMAHYALSLVSSVMSSATVTHMTTATVTSSSSPCLPPVSLLVWPSTLQAETAHYRSVTAQCPVTATVTVKVWIESKFSAATSLCKHSKNWLWPNTSMWTSKRKAYYGIEDILRDYHLSYNRTSATDNSNQKHNWKHFRVGVNCTRQFNFVNVWLFSP